MSTVYSWGTDSRPRLLFGSMTRLFATLALVVSAPLFAQDYSEQVSVSYVMIPFTVLGAKGVPITDLRAKEVSLLVDEKPVLTDMFQISKDAPVSWTILLDGSGSMGLAGKMDAAKAVIDTLTARRRNGDDFALYSFDSRGHANELVPFTENPAAIRRAVDVVKPWGKTAFFDALAEMPAQSELGRNPSRAIILLSDGIDNASTLARADIEKRMEGVSIPVYAFGLREPAEQHQDKVAPISEEMSNLSVLEDLAAATGGRLYVGNQPDELANAVNSIEKALRAQYLIGFSPTGKGAVKYRRISLKLAGRVRSVRVRAGYRGTEPPVSGTRSRERHKGNERKKS